MNTAAFSQTWLDTSLYPFEHHYQSLSAGNMHYVDEGEGEILLFVHGTPTWSFLYRDFVKTLSKEYRCIAVDHLGFGLSEKEDTLPSTPQWHSKNLSEFIKKLNLKNITLVVHDYGGPIGIGAALEQPERVNKIVLFNSWLWATKDNPSAQKIDKTIDSKLGRFLYLSMNFSPKVLLKKGFSDKKNLSKTVHKHYKAPFPSKTSREPLLDLGKALVGSSDWYQEQWEQLDLLADKEWLILWGMEDQFITQEYYAKWTNRLPNASTLAWDCGHFVQEERTEEAIRAIEAFMKDKSL